MSEKWMQFNGKIILQWCVNWDFQVYKYVPMYSCMAYTSNKKELHVFPVTPWFMIITIEKNPSH